MTPATIQLIADFLRREYDAGAEQHVLDQLVKWTDMDSHTGTLAAWLEILKALERQASTFKAPQN